MLRKHGKQNNKIMHFFSVYLLKNTLAITIYILWKRGSDNWIKVTGAERLGLGATENRDSSKETECRSSNKELSYAPKAHY